MKPSPSKNQLREEIDRQVREYLGEGGEIEKVEKGASGITEIDFRQHSPGFAQPRHERTPLTDVVAAIEARRQTATGRRKQNRPRVKGPRRKAVYDDFGELIRWVWVED